MNEILNFTFQQMPVRVLLKEDGIYFVYRDLRRIPGFRSAAEKADMMPTYQRIKTAVGSTMVRLLPRNTVFTVLSHMKDSRSLSKWIMEDVLPEIYKRPGCERFRPRPPWESRRQANVLKPETPSGEQKEIQNLLLAYFALMRMLMSVPVERQAILLFGFTNDAPGKKGCEHD